MALKKWTYLISGIVIWAIVVTSGSAVAAQVKSLIGQKVTAEYIVTVNGKTLADKGAVVAGITNVPVRAIADAIGAELKVEGKTITITTENGSNKIQKTLLSVQKSSLETEIERLQKEKKIHEEKYADSEEGFGKDIFKQALDSINQQISDQTQELNRVNAALTALEAQQ
jgi:hypothetical protein